MQGIIFIINVSKHTNTVAVIVSFIS